MLDDDYPALYGAADSSSQRGQQRFLMATRVRLIGLVVAAAGSLGDWDVGDTDLAGLVGLVAFVVAIAASVYILNNTPDRLWYEGRAAAESAKTLTWRYMVGGEPLPLTLSADAADRTFLEQLRGLLHGLDGLDMTQSSASEYQITPEMRRLRSRDLATRRQAYEEGRLADQHAWYHARAAWNARRGRLWSLAGLVIEFAGIVAGALKAFVEGFDLDALGLLAALAAALTAWSHAKQHQMLSRAYFIASQELATIRSQLHLEQTEEAWARFVQGSEEAISREHTLWRVSGGARLRV